VRVRGAVNQTSNNDPTLINNTGNYNIPNITIIGIHLRGETISSEFIDVGNITVGNGTGSNAECNLGPATSLVNGTGVEINNTVLSRGNHSINNGETGQEELYYCIREVSSTISSQSYSTSNSGAWKIKIT